MKTVTINITFTVSLSFLYYILLDCHSGLGGALDSAWLCLCGALVMFMHAGFAMLETGSCRVKNASNVLMKNLVNVSWSGVDVLCSFVENFFPFKS